MANPDNPRLAVLIDADNAQAKAVHELLAEVSRYGTATVKRAYGDWTTQNLKGWKEVLHEMAIQPIQQFSYTSGKNSTDSALIIDAMDLLHVGVVDGFCLVSSDSDFTRLATRIREAGLPVYGFGEKKTPTAFVNACDKFIYSENLRQASGAAVDKKADPAKLKREILSAMEAVAREDGWAPLSAVGSMLVKNNPAFDAREHGFAKLGALVKSLKYLEVKEVRSNDDSPTAQWYIRPKSNARTTAHVHP